MVLLERLYQYLSLACFMLHAIWTDVWFHSHHVPHSCHPYSNVYMPRSKLLSTSSCVKVEEVQAFLGKTNIVLEAVSNYTCSHFVLRFLRLNLSSYKYLQHIAESKKSPFLLLSRYNLTTTKIFLKNYWLFNFRIIISWKLLTLSPAACI